jgi:mannose-6-phosphate isomerase-like protein (cupin superfamily)
MLPYTRKELTVDSIRVKGTVATLVFVYLAGGIFVSGCSTHLNAHHDYKATMMPSGEVLVIALTDNHEYLRLLAGKPQTHGMRSGRVYLMPGETCGRHSTKAYEEVLVFLSGKGTALIGEEEKAFDVGLGRVCYIPPQTVHNIKNTGTEPLIYVYCVVPVK